MQLSCFFDYTCPYSYRAFAWLNGAAAAGADIEVSWRTFSLREANREPDAPSPLEDDEIRSTSLLALALSHAAREGDFDRYHRAVFRAMQVEERHLEEADLLAMALEAGVDTAVFDRARPRWLAAVAADHRDAVSRFGVFGTPSFVLDGQAVVFVKLAALPEAGRELDLWNSLCTLARCFPDLLEIKRPPR